MKLIFRDNFFNSGQTEIMNENQETVGHLDLKGLLGSSLDVFDAGGTRLYAAKFSMLSNKWRISDSTEKEIGVLRSRIAFFSKRYEYEALGRGTFEITSPAFSREYEVLDANGARVAFFSKVSGWFESGAYCLEAEEGKSALDPYELVAVIMGMHEIQKRHRNSSAS